MDTHTILIYVYCIVDDFMKGKRIRTRGPQPLLSDSEVITMEIIGSFLGIGYFFTAVLHTTILAIIDRFATPFNWLSIIVILLIIDYHIQQRRSESNIQPHRGNQHAWTTN